MIAILGGLSPAPFLLFAERLGRVQVMGVGLIVVGVSVLAAASA